MTTKAGGKFYAIGDRKVGIVLVFFEPLRVLTVGVQEIRDYAARTGEDFDMVFAQIGRACVCINSIYGIDKGLDKLHDMHAGLEQIFQSRMNLVDADFCFIGDVDLDKISERRRSLYPIEAVKDLVDPRNPGKNPEEIPLEQDPGPRRK